MKYSLLFFAAAILFLFSSLPSFSENSSPAADSTAVNNTQNSTTKTQDDAQVFHVPTASSQSFYEGNQQRVHRLELGALYEYLIPNAIYSNFGTLYLGYSIKPRQDFTYFFQAHGYGRAQGNAISGMGGVYKDWGKHFYTYSSVLGGSNSAYIPRYRYDQDFNFVLGKSSPLVFTAGFTTMKFFNRTDFVIWSGGLTYHYHKKWLFQYRYFDNKTFPGGTNSHAYFAGIGYGKEGKKFTYVTGSVGKLAYLPSYLTSSADIQNNAWSVSLQHRRWLNEDQGGFFSLNYLKLSGSATEYDKYGIFVGIFHDY